MTPTELLAAIDAHADALRAHGDAEWADELLWRTRRERAVLAAGGALNGSTVPQVEWFLTGWLFRLPAVPASAAQLAAVLLRKVEDA